MLERAATWNGWNEEETFLQLAGHLWKRVLQEWSLLGSRDKKSLKAAMSALHIRFDPVSQSVAAQDFRHARQKESESVADFILRLERTFLSAYSRDSMSTETRETLLHGQLQEGLCYEIMESSAVSGATHYSQLCLTARNEEKQQYELAKRRQLDKPTRRLTFQDAPASNPPRTNLGTPLPLDTACTCTKAKPSTTVRCYNCNQPGHFSRGCRTLNRGSPGRDRGSSFAPPNVGGLGRHPYGSARQVKTPVQFESLQGGHVFLR